MKFIKKRRVLLCKYEDTENKIALYREKSGVITLMKNGLIHGQYLDDNAAAKSFHMYLDGYFFRKDDDNFLFDFLCAIPIHKRFPLTKKARGK